MQPNSLPTSADIRNEMALLVTDDDEQAAQIEHALRSAQDARFGISRVSRLSEALDRLRERTFDVVLADMFLPDGTGSDVVSALREAAPNAAIMVTTRADTEGEAAELLRAGADDYCVLQNMTRAPAERLVREVNNALTRRTITNRYALLVESTSLLSTYADVEEAVRTIASIVVPRMADGCVVEHVGATGKLLRAETQFNNGSATDGGNGKGSGNGSLDGSAPYAVSVASRQRTRQDRHWSPMVGRAIRRGNPELFASVDSETLQALSYGEKHRKQLEALRISSLMIVPLVVNEERIGCITFLRFRSHAHYTPGDLDFAEQFCQRCALALENTLLYAELEQALHQQQELLSSITHDLRTPLTSIRAGLGLLQMKISDKLTPEELEMLRNVRRGGERLRILVEQLTAFNQMARGTFELEQETFDLTAAVRDCVDMLQVLFDKKGQRVEVRMPPSLPYTGDPRLITTAITNLIGNAHEHTPQGTQIVITGSVTDGGLRLSVSDTGPGVPADQKQVIFERYYKADSARQGRGLGIGLTTARQVIVMHGGNLLLEDTPGGGATFSIILPLPQDNQRRPRQPRRRQAAKL